MATLPDQHVRTRLPVRAPIQPMLAKAMDHIPSGPADAWAYEPKLDGFRGIVVVNGDRGVDLHSRRGARLNETFPEIVWSAFDHVPAGTVLDGEIVRWGASGRLDFTALHRRNIAGRRRAASMARTEPCHFAAFDVVRVRGRDVSGLPLRERRALLEELFAPIPAAGVLALGMHTTDEAEARIWYETLHVAGVEGLVCKPTRSTYDFGVRGWVKVKRRTSSDAVVGGYVGSPRRPSGLLARYDAGGRLRVVGRTTQLSKQAAAELAPLLTPAGAGHPWPQTLPPGWASSPYGQRDPISYHQVQPTLVVEVLVDTAQDYGHRHRHAVRYLRVRADLHPMQLDPID
ncbi:RNA ligase family protein [Nonomuraea sp. NPDC049637]|uniref:ATP-dependent DNA ligase n=1 Tax=Nonomuraea sp. NPDC049637 TaxID=3154356 RepID=UPI003442100F